MSGWTCRHREKEGHTGRDTERAGVYARLVTSCMEGSVDRRESLDKERKIEKREFVREKRES